MEFETITYDKSEMIGTVTLRRPERGNALNFQMADELRRVVDDIASDDGIRVMIVNGGDDAKGRPCFSVGADIKDLGGDHRLFLLEVNALLNQIEDLPKVTIAAIDGICTAGGIELALTFDLRVVAESVRIGDLHLKNLGSGLGGAGASTRLPRIVGLSNAKQLIFTGDLVDGNEAYRIGLANSVCPSAQLMQVARGLAGKAAAMRPAGVKITKAHLNLGMQMDLYQALRYAELITPLADPEGMKAVRSRQAAFAERGKQAFKEGQ